SRTSRSARPTACTATPARRSSARASPRARPAAPSGGGAVPAGAVQDDLVLGDAHGYAAAELADRVLEPLVGEGHHRPAAVADEMVVVPVAGPDRLVARHVLPDLDFLDETQPLELVEDAVDARAGGPGAGPAAGVLD